MRRAPCTPAPGRPDAGRWMPGTGAARPTQRRRRILAEREGFEPSDPVSQVNSLAVSPIRPLSHLSRTDQSKLPSRARATADRSGSARPPRGLRVSGRYGRSRRRGRRTGSSPTRGQGRPCAAAPDRRTGGRSHRRAPGPDPRRFGVCGPLSEAVPVAVALRRAGLPTELFTDEAIAAGAEPGLDGVEIRRRASPTPDPHGRGGLARGADRQHAHGPAGPHRQGPRVHPRGQARAFQPGRLVQGPHHAAP